MYDITRIIPASMVKQNLSVDDFFNIMEDTYQLLYLNKEVNPPKYSLIPPGSESDLHFINSMPAYSNKYDMAGIKWVSVMSDNHSNRLPTTMGTIILNCARTGYPVAILDASYLTQIRTGISAAIGAKYLARTESETVTLIGPGDLGSYALEGTIKNFNIKRVNIVGKSSERIKSFKKHFSSKYEHIEFIDASNDLNRVLLNSDIIFVTTSSVSPVIDDQKIREGTFLCNTSVFLDLSIKVLDQVDTVVLDHKESALKRVKQLRDIDFSNVQHIHDIGEFINLNIERYTNSHSVTFYMPVGLGLIDIALATYLFNKLEKLEHTKNNYCKLYDL